MKKIIFIIAFIPVFIFAQCPTIDHPDLQTSPVWKSGSPNAIINLSNDCKIELEWCWRIVNGKKQIMLGKRYYKYTGSSSPFDFFGKISCIVAGLASETSKMTNEAATYEIIINLAPKIFEWGEYESLPCFDKDGNQQWSESIEIFESKCKTEQIYDTYNRYWYDMPCEGSGYCKVETKYCWGTKIDSEGDRVPWPYTERTILNSTSDQDCDLLGGPYDSNECYPLQCYGTHSHPVVSIEDILTLTDQQFYIGDIYYEN